MPHFLAFCPYVLNILNILNKSAVYVEAKYVPMLKMLSWTSYNARLYLPIGMRSEYDWVPTMVIIHKTQQKRTNIHSCKSAIVLVLTSDWLAVQ